MMTVHAPIGVLLGGLLLVAGVGKLARREAFAQALTGYRLARPQRLVAWAVPAAEIAVGAALGCPPGPRAALALLAVFSLALGVAAAGTAAGLRLPAGARPPGPLSLVRNALLGLAAVAAALGLHPALGRAFWTVSYVALWAAVLGLAALVLALYRQVGVLHLRLGPGHAFEHEAEGLPLGEPAPDGIAGRLVVFTSRDCPICAQIVPGLRALASDHAIAVERVRYEDDRGRDLYEQFLVPGTPYAVYVDSAGYVRAKGTINTLEQLEGMVVSGRIREREQLVGDRAA
jgi:hypothetical protein